MYKVFVNDKPIIFTTSIKNEENYPAFIYKNTTLDEVIYKLKLGKLQGVYLFSTNLPKDWEDFRMKFKVMIAAGGLVLNDNEEVLFIYRGNKWDLPKGRIEKGEGIEETAIREVEEECGVSNLEIIRKLTNTYHLFLQKGEHRLKETHWYLMHSTHQGALTPQIEEGITKVVFKNTEETILALQNTYCNIKLVYSHYKEMIN
ncbi:NUDIX domain-containing protein [Tenacibaculum aiptasiae]|uniref:NUDIX domain-containing protein n=1 Tax=Tenacibaculum aiptasiae TaxID=426481 RepID=A0A7J5AAN0_9FLAO|nr:NUDIX domain-containing protein [Tenacibaculum aiptasiae]KAB1154631.1 NUDIX domain-containing protein [Tenacibaculum aiptasiae]